MGSEFRQFVVHILTWVLYASAGFGAVAYALFLRTRRVLQRFEETQGLISSAPPFNPRDLLVRKQRGIEALRGLAIVVMLVGFLLWPLLILGALLFFFQSNAWKSTQRDLVSLDRDHPDYKLAQQQHADALSDSKKVQRTVLETRGEKWQRVFAITMGIALLFAVALLALLMTGSSAPGRT